MGSSSLILACLIVFAYEQVQARSSLSFISQMEASHEPREDLKNQGDYKSVLRGQSPSTVVPDPNGDEEMVLFAADGRKKPYSFEDDTGKLVGFDVDIISAVCGVANKKCRIVLAEFTECVFTDNQITYAGRGLMTGWFEGCPGYMITTDRKIEFDFTLPYLETHSTFAVLPGNPKKFDPVNSDYTKFNIVHLTGAPTSEPCLNRLNKTYNPLLVAGNLPEALALLNNGTADVLFSPRTKINGLEILPGDFQCDEGQGAGILLRKGSSLPAWWNPAFQTVYMSGVYTQLCNTVEKKYGRIVPCLPPPTTVNASLLITTKQQEAEKDTTRLWKFVVSGTIADYSFMNKKGELVGFTKEMISNVCQIAGKKCVLMLSGVKECTHRTGELLYPGRGLMENWFDACTGYFNTVDRSNSWDFTSPYLVSNASFYVAPGNPRKFDPSMDDYSSFVLVYAATAITNDHCLHRLRKKFSKLVQVPDEPAAIKAILTGEADAWFTKRLGVTQLERLPQRFHCENVGTSVMVKKGSQLPSWWNPAFKFFLDTGGFNKFCEAQGKIYNVNFPCVQRGNVNE